MTQIAWGEPGQKRYHAGVDRGVLYPQGRRGVPWNGLIGVNEAPTGAESWRYYFDGVHYHTGVTNEDFGGTIEAYTYPDEFAECDGTASYGGLSFDQQPRKPFHLSYRTKVGNDTDGIAHGYFIHLLYNVMALPSPRANKAIAQTPTPMAFSWAIVAKPEPALGVKPSAHLKIDSRKTNPRLLAQLEGTLYGTETTEARFPTVEELVAVFAGALEIVYDPDGYSDIIEFVNNFDLMGNIEVGVFLRPPTSRLVETDVPGIYRLET